MAKEKSCCSCFFSLIVLFTILMIGCIIVMTITNPKMEDYRVYLHQNILKESENEGDLTKLIASLFGGVGADIIIKQTVRKDYVIFSYYETKLSDEKLISIGMFNNFIVLESPIEK